MTDNLKKWGPVGARRASLLIEPMLLVDDRPLLESFRAGDREALTRVFESYAPKVGRWIASGFNYASRDGLRRFSGFASAADRHDAVHEVFRAAFESRARVAYSGLSAYEGYLFVITKNVVMKRLKSRALDRVSDDVLERIATTEPSPEEIVARAEQERLVREYLATLGDSERMFVSLRFHEQLSQNEVGTRLGWTRKKVRIAETGVRESLIRFMKRARGSKEHLEEVLSSAHGGAK